MISVESSISLFQCNSKLLAVNYFARGGVSFFFKLPLEVHLTEAAGRKAIKISLQPMPLSKSLCTGLQLGVLERQLGITPQ